MTKRRRRRERGAGRKARGRPPPSEESPAARSRHRSRWSARAGALLFLAVVVVCAVSLLGPGWGNGEDPPGGASSTPVYGYRLVNTYPHDPHAFTQGLVYHQGYLYEGTGQWGRSSLRKIALESGEVKRSLPLPGRYFGEGITIIGERVIQLTWQAGIGFVYRLDGFRKIAEFHYPGEGWGITHDGKRLIMSDGSATLRFLDPRTFKENGRVTVRDRGVPVPRLNELEHIRGEIYANVWKTDRIARISPKDGSVRGWIDLRGLLSPRDRLPSTDVLNGIAYDAKGKRLFVTGKDWPKLFEIELVEKRPERGPARPGVPGGKEQ